MNTLKFFTLAGFALAALLSSASLTDETVFDKIPGTATIGEIVTAGGGGGSSIPDAITNRIAALESSKVDKADISATDPTFSNAVLAVTINTNLVEHIGELNEYIHDYGELGATSLGGLLLAILGALAFLKKNALTGGITEGRPDDQKVGELFAALAVSPNALKDKTYDFTDPESLITFYKDVAAVLGVKAAEPVDEMTGSALAGKYGVVVTDATTYGELETKASLSDTDPLRKLIK